MTESDSSKPPRADHRSGPRRRVLLPGLIVHGNETYTCDCVFRNLSATGARIVINEHLQFPERFHLINIRDGVVYGSRLIWTKGREVGVQFETVTSLAVNTDLSFRKLRRLWLAKAPH